MVTVTSGHAPDTRLYKTDPGDAVDVDMIVKIRNGDWERRQLPVDQPTTYCLTNRPTAIGSFYLVVSDQHLIESHSVHRCVHRHGRRHQLQLDA